MLGLLPYIYLMYQYNSYRAGIIFMNGICYHYNDKNVEKVENPEVIKSPMAYCLFYRKKNSSI